MAGQIIKDDIGSRIRVTIREQGSLFNVSAATTKTLKLMPPSGTVKEVAMTFETNGADGVLQYTLVDGDIDESGPWSGQVYLVFPTGTWHTEKFNFNVGEHF